MHVEGEGGKDVCLAFYHKNGKKELTKVIDIFYQKLTSN
jgi:hypothetical protein